MIFIVLNNLKSGEIIDNYKLLCQALNEPIRTGSSKTCQMKKWERYFKFTRIQGTKKFKIETIYDTPLPYTDGRVEGNNSKYPPIIKKLLTNIFSIKQSTQLQLQMRYLVKAFGMTNHNFLQFVDYDVYDFQLDNCRVIKPHEIRGLISRCNNTLKKIIITSLDSLKKREIISYQSCYKIVDKYGSDTLANNDQELMIKQFEQQCLEDMGVDNIFSVYSKGCVKLYYKQLHDYWDEYGWKSVYKVLDLTLLSDPPDKLSTTEVFDLRQKLNMFFVDRMKHIIRYQYETNMAQVTQYKQNPNDTKVFELPADFLDIQERLIDYFITLPKISTTEK